MSDEAGSFDVVDRRHPVESALIDESTLDPSLEYRFVQERPTQISRMKLQGYRIVKPSKDGVKTYYEQEDGHPEDIIKHGDRVLMAVPRKKRQQRREAIRQRAEQRLKSNDQKVRELARQRKITLHETDEEDD